MKQLITAFLLAACSCALGGELSDIYHKKVNANLEQWLEARKKSAAVAPNVATNCGVTEIGIERTVCYGTCPAYTFIVKSDGTFRYKGDKYVERLGEFTGTIWVGGFNRLAQFIKDSGYMELEDTYERSVTDNATVFTMVVMNGKQKVISDYANAGPSKLWAVEQLVDHLMTGAHWNEQPATSGAKK